MSRPSKAGTYQGRPKFSDIPVIEKDGRSYRTNEDVDQLVEKLSDEALLGGGNTLVGSDTAASELRRRRVIEKYRYYKIPKYFDGLAKSTANTKVLC